MMTESELVAAVVKTTRFGSQGSLLNGRMVLTAAHCIEYSLEGEMVLGDTFVEEIETASGQRILMAPIFIDPVADIAVLGPVDGQEPRLATHNDAFHDFTEVTKGLRLSTVTAELFEKFPLRVRSHRGKWITGTGQFCEPTHRSVWVTADEAIEGGTSGGPIIDAIGNQIGVVSFASDVIDGEECCDGSTAFAVRCLPAWIIEQNGEGNAE